MRVPEVAFRAKKCCGKLWSFARLSYAESMLPILRIIPVGGVLLAIMILVLALNPPGGSHSSLAPGAFAARGPLIQQNEHPEWRQFLILAAIRRAGEIIRLRDLPDTPVRSGGAQDAEKDASKVAGLPAERRDADPDDQTGSTNETPGATIPIEIGETSSTELPMLTPEETPPVIKTPERVKLPKESKKRPVHRGRGAKTAKPDSVAQFDLIEYLFGGGQAKKAAAAK